MDTYTDNDGSISIVKPSKQTLKVTLQHTSKHTSKHTLKHTLKHTFKDTSKDTLHLQIIFSMYISVATFETIQSCCAGN